MITDMFSEEEKVKMTQFLKNENNDYLIDQVFLELFPKYIFA